MATAKAVKAKALGEVATYAVLSQLNHDGDAYVLGDRIELDSVTAKPLVDLKVIEPAKD